MYQEPETKRERAIKYLMWMDKMSRVEAERLVDLYIKCASEQYDTYKCPHCGTKTHEGDRNHYRYWDSNGGHCKISPPTFRTKLSHTSYGKGI